MNDCERVFGCRLVSILFLCRKPNRGYGSEGSNLTSGETSISSSPPCVSSSPTTTRSETSDQGSVLRRSRRQKAGTHSPSRSLSARTDRWDEDGGEDVRSSSISNSITTTTNENLLGFDRSTTTSCLCVCVLIGTIDESFETRRIIPYRLIGMIHNARNCRHAGIIERECLFARRINHHCCITSTRIESSHDRCHMHECNATRSSRMLSSIVVIRRFGNSNYDCAIQVYIHSFVRIILSHLVSIRCSHLVGTLMAMIRTFVVSHRIYKLSSFRRQSIHSCGSASIGMRHSRSPHDTKSNRRWRGEWVVVWLRIYVVRLVIID